MFCPWFVSVISTDFPADTEMISFFVLSYTGTCGMKICWKNDLCPLPVFNLHKQVCATVSATGCPLLKLLSTTLVSFTSCCDLDLYHAVICGQLLLFSFNPEAWRFFRACLPFKLTGFVWLRVTFDQWNLVDYVAKPTRFLAPLEHVLFTCSETFQVFRAQEHVLFTCFETLWSAKRPTLKFVVLQTALTPRWFGKGR